MRDFLVAIYESDLSDVEKEYLISTTESALTTGLMIIGGTLAGVVAAAGIQLMEMKAAETKYEKLYPDVPKWKDLIITDKMVGVLGIEKTAPQKLSGTNAKAVIRANESAKHICIGETSDGSLLFEIRYENDMDHGAGYKIVYKSRNKLGYEHSGYYTLCFCRAHKYYFPGLTDWISMIKKQYRESKKKIVKESSDIFNNDNIINAGIMAGIGTQVVTSSLSEQERLLRGELNQLQTAVNQFGNRMSSNQRQLMMRRSGLILEELSQLERRKGTALAVRNASLMIAAATKIKRSLDTDRAYGPDNPDMLRLIGGLPG